MCAHMREREILNNYIIILKFWEIQIHTSTVQWKKKIILGQGYSYTKVSKDTVIKHASIEKHTI